MESFAKNKYSEKRYYDYHNKHRQLGMSHVFFSLIESLN